MKQTITYTYNSENLLTEIINKVNNNIKETRNYTYDNNGNQLITQVTDETGSAGIALENEYDEFNQLIESKTASQTVKNSYNGEGYRTSKTVGDNTTNFLYEGDKVVLETDNDNNEKARNIYGLNLLTRKVDNKTYNYMYNGHADVTALLDSTTGEVAGTYYYDAFGKIIEKTGSVNNNIRYAGYQYDEETGLYYLNARMYDPETARFLQEDTYTGDIKDPLSLNLYTYCNNNPLVYDDQTGPWPSWSKLRNGIKKISRTVKSYRKKVSRTVKKVSRTVKKYRKKVSKTVKKYRKKIGRTVRKYRKKIKKAASKSYRYVKKIRKKCSIKRVIKKVKRITRKKIKKVKQYVKSNIKTIRKTIRKTKTKYVRKIKRSLKNASIKAKKTVKTIIKKSNETRKTKKLTKSKKHEEN